MHLDVINESEMHGVPPGSESHFKVIVVASQFEGKSPLDRHRKINLILEEELQASLHALTIQARTPAEWESTGGKITSSPPCASH